MAIERNKKQNIVQNSRLDSVKTSGLDDFIKSAPDEMTEIKRTLKRDSKTFRINPQLWIDYDYWCKNNKTTRSNELEKFILNQIEKSKNDYL